MMRIFHTESPENLATGYYFSYDCVYALYLGVWDKGWQIVLFVSTDPDV